MTMTFKHYTNQSVEEGTNSLLGIFKSTDLKVGHSPKTINNNSWTVNPNIFSAYFFTLVLLELHTHAHSHIQEGYNY